jgi:hypothetical protein
VITLELYQRLYDDIFDKGIVAGFGHDVFTHAMREPKVRNYDRTSLDRMPDMLIGLADRQNVFKRSQDFLFIECKPVDRFHSVSQHYCDKGIVRFVRGDYAWAMTSAMMIGYVRKGYSVRSHLAKALSRRGNGVCMISPLVPCQRSKPGASSEAVHISEHSRAFIYVETGQQAPAITLRHLWLQRD